MSVPSDPTAAERLRLSRWADALEAAIEAPERERVDILLDLVSEVEAAWLALCEQAEAAA